MPSDGAGPIVGAKTANKVLRSATASKVLRSASWAAHILIRACVDIHLLDLLGVDHIQRASLYILIIAY